MSTEKTQVTTGLVRFSYMHVHTPSSMNDEDAKKYSTSMIIPKSDKKSLSKIKKAIEAAIEKGVSEKFNGKRPKNLKTPLRDGDEERDDDESYEDSFFINASTTRKPKLVDKGLQEIIDPEDVYSGMYGRASLNFYAYNVNGNKGIAAGLNNIQKLRDGERLGGGSSSVEADFDDDFDDEDDDF